MMPLNLQRFLGIALTATFLILALGANPAEAARRKKHIYRPPQDRFAEIVVEASTGYVLSEKNADKKLYPASLTKMMTLYLTFDALERGALSRSQRLFVSKRASVQEPSSLGLEHGASIRVEDAILAIVTKSANDVAVVLAEAIGGSEDRFANMMTQKARQLGMNNTRFVNASGLFKPQQVSSARDMAILAQALIRDHPRHYRYFGTESFTYKGNTYLNHNKLMKTYPGMDGFKTGYVYASGYNLTASAVRNGTRLIGVVFGGNTAQGRNKAMAQLLDRGFSDVRSVRVASLIQKKGQKPVSVRKPTVLPVDAETVAETTPAAGVTAAVDQGDTNFSGDDAPAKKFISEFQPRPLNTTVLTDRTANSGVWAVQIGAYASRDAGTKALHYAKKNLRGVVNGVDSIAPLMTTRGMVYRARLSGLARTDATQACEILKGNCLILTAD